MSYVKRLLVLLFLAGAASSLNAADRDFSITGPGTFLGMTLLCAAPMGATFTIAP